MNAPDDVSLPDLAADRSTASIVMDGDGRVIESSERAAALLGLLAPELNGAHLRDIAADGWELAVRNALMRLATGSVDRFDLLLRGAEGRHRLVQMLPRRLRVAGPARYMVVWREALDDLAGATLTASEMELAELVSGLLQVQETERGRVAGELNDELAPLIAMAKLMAEDASRHIARGTPQHATVALSSAVDRLRDALSEVRRISMGLRPSSLDDLGLLPTLEWFCRGFARAHPQVQVDLEVKIDEAAISSRLRLDLFRIVEEALVNVGRHAGASRVRVTLGESLGEMQLKIQDDGNGFDLSSLVRGKSSEKMGIGLRCISQRVAATRGSLVIESTARRGTSVVASWPLDEVAAGPR